MKQPLLALALLLAALSSTALAHDFWIEPADFAPRTGGALKIGLRVGDAGRGEAVQRNEPLIERFVRLAPGGDRELPIVGRHGGFPAGYARLEEAGIHVLGYRSRRSFVELAPAKFESYLHEEGLEDFPELHPQLVLGERPVREYFSRCARSLVRVGENAERDSEEGYDRMLDLTLELLPEKNPFELGPGPEGEGLEPLPVRLFFEGRPLAGALVGVVPIGAPGAEGSGAGSAPPTGDLLTGRTDAEGRVMFELPHSGRWLFAAVHMVPFVDDESADVESFWASLTFEVPTAPAR